MFLTEIQGILGSCSLVYHIHADSEVKKVDKLTAKNKLKAERHGNGGTAYGPALKKCVELKCTAIVYLGDMDCADIPENPQIPVLWVTAGNTIKPGNFGQIIVLEKK